MAFSNSKTNGITDLTSVYTPTGDTGTIIGLTLCPTSGSDSVVDVKIGGTYLCKGLTITSGTTVVPVGGEQKVVVLNGEDVMVASDTTVDVVVSFLE